jgi:outer membrane protein insertion porin family
VLAIMLLLFCGSASAQLTRPSTSQPAPGNNDAFANILPEFRGRLVEEVRVEGNSPLVPTSVIMNMVRTREGEKFDAATVQEDYQRIFGLKKFSNVEARVEPTPRGGVIVIYVVTETRQIKSVSPVGNKQVSTLDINKVTTDVQPGETIDRFRIALAKQAIENLYREKNFPFARVDVDQDTLTKTGDLVFRITEGPQVTVRNIRFKGATHMSNDKLKDQIHTSTWFPIFRSGTFSLDTIDEDVASIRRYYQAHGYFDVKVGRKIIVSPDQSEVQVDFLIDEGPQYIVDRVTFKGNTNVSEAELRSKLKMIEGKPYDADLLQRDVREVVRAYSPYGYIYDPQARDPSFLRIDTKNLFRQQPGKVEIVYDISEGKEFYVGEIHVKGNRKTQEKLVLRELRVTPGQKYNSAEFQDAIDRLRATPYYTNVTITPIGDDPNVRDVLVEVTEGRTANFGVGAGVNSNGGIGGTLSFEQRNFDITAWPSNGRDFFSERAFTGAGQTFRISVEPGTQATNANIRFVEPWVFDQPYSFSIDAYIRDRQRDDYKETRIGARPAVGKRFNYEWTGQVFLRAEDVEIHDIDDPAIRAPEINDFDGHTTLTSAGVQIRRNTTNPGPLPYKGTNTTLGWESYGALGGDLNFQKFTLSFDAFQTLYEDLTDRKTILRLYSDAGYIPGGADEGVFFERFYAGGIGSIRGFRFRGVSPRSGPSDDVIGGNFTLTSGAEVSFPIMGDQLRGVVFSDQGTVERDLEIKDYRVTVGAGIRLVLPFLGQAPLSLDFAVPINSNGDDDAQLISFSFGFSQ